MPASDFVSLDQPRIAVSPGSIVSRVLIVALAYAVAGKLGLLLAIPPGYATAVWPASGVALAAILLWGRSMWIGVMLGSFAVNLSTSWDSGSAGEVLRSLALASAIGAGAAAQAVIGAALIRQVGGLRNIFTQEVRIFRVLLLGGPLSCVTNASLGVGSLWTAGLIPDENLLFNWWTWWVGDSIGVLIFMPLICAWSLRPRAEWLRKQIALTVPLVVVFAAVVALFFYASAGEQRRLSADFDARASRYADTLQEALDANLRILSSLRSFYNASVFVSRKEFETFLEPLMHEYPAVQALGWAPRVEADALPSFLETISREQSGDYRIKDYAADNRFIVAGARADYYPIAYIVPGSGNAEVLGFDVRSEPLRRAAFERALASGRAAATERVRLMQDREARASVLIFLPLLAADRTRDAPPGMLSALIRLDALAATALDGLEREGLRARLHDPLAEPATATLLSIGPPDELAPDAIAEQRSIAVHIADRKWSLEVLLPADYLVTHRSWQAWGLLAVGLSLTALLEMLLLVMLARQSRVEELVNSRTAELQQAEQSFRGLLESAPDAMVMIDDRGCIELINRQTEVLFGYSRAELIGQPIERLVPERYRAAHGGHRRGFFGDPRTRPMGAGLDLRAQRRDGSEFPVEISLASVAIGTRRNALAAVRDISERSAVQRQLAAYAASLESSNKELEQYAYVASHDLQAPLRGMLSFAQLLRQRYAGKVLEGKGEEFLGHIESSARHMEALIRDLLTFSRAGQHEPAAEVALDGVLAEVKGQLAGIVRERGAIIEHEPLPVVRGARLQLFQLLQNLIANGLKFQPGESPRIRVRAAREGGVWRISVQDQGIGIAPKDQERVFRIFQRLHGGGSYEGSGIGLAICQKIVAGHGGRIWVESALGQGATFHFTLPAVGT